MKTGIASVTAALAIALPGAASGPAVSSPSAASAGPALHAIAYVTDSRSHGVVGDGLLSLEEAILLHNNQLPITSLSAAEAAQVSLIPGNGNTSDVTWIDIDGSSTPVITVERDLTPIVDSPFGLLIKGFNDPPVIDFSGPGVTTGFVAPSNSVSFEDLILRGGPFGIDITQTDVSGLAGTTCLNVRFEDQTDFGLRIRATTPGGVGRVILEDCAFQDLPRAVIADESGANRISIFEARNLLIRGAARGIDITLGSGGNGRYTLDRLDIEATQSGVNLTRPSNADRLAAIESTSVRLRAQVCGTIDGSATGPTIAELRMWDAIAPPGGTALRFGQSGDSMAGAIEDSTFGGDVVISTGSGLTPLIQENLRFTRGTTEIYTGSTRPSPLRTSRFDDVQLFVRGTGGLDFEGCCFVGGSLENASTAVVATSNSHLATAMVGSVQPSSSLPAEQLGSMSVSPSDVLLGGSVTLQADLPPGLTGFFFLGPTDPSPILLPQPYRVYTPLALTFPIPGSFRGQQSVTLQVPSQLSLAGLELTAQIAVVPDPGVAAPSLQLPPGKRFVLQGTGGAGGGGGG